MKKWKISLMIIVLVLAGGAGTLYYLMNGKDYKTADPKVDHIVKNHYKIQLPDSSNTNVSQQKSNQTNQTEVPHQKINGPDTGRKTDNGQAVSQDVIKAGTLEAANSNHYREVAEHGGKTAAVQQETAESIIAKYSPSFNDLENQANNKLDSLLSYALQEYKTKKAKGETISYFYFYSKYSKAAKTLEANTDAAFNMIYNDLVKDLEKSGYSASLANPIKDQYLSQKKQRSSAILDKATAYLK